MYQLNVTLGIQAYINDECWAYLTAFFTEDSIKIPSIQRTFCNYDKIEWIFYYKHIRPLLIDKSYRTGRQLYLWPKTGDDGDFSAYRYTHVFIGFFSVPEAAATRILLNPLIITSTALHRSESHVCNEHQLIVKRYHINMRNTLKFRPEIMERVIQIYDDVTRKMHMPKKDITFIGVHNRRTDHLAWTKKQHNQEPLTSEYFYDAMDAFR